MGAAAGRHPGDRRDDHRQPGGHHRRLLDGAPGINLGFLPRMEILFTSETNTGQIFVPSVNAVLFIGVIFLVLSFKTSDALATAYGISVTGAMVVTSIMAFEFVRARWNWSLPVAVIALAPLVVLEMIFLGANLLKIHDGGYIPIMIATAFTVVMWTGVAARRS